MLTISKNVSGETAALSLEGRLDTVTAPELEAELKNTMEVISDLQLDFGKLDYISSAGLRILLAAQKVMAKKGSMTVTHVNETIMEIFDVTGFSDILTIE